MDILSAPHLIIILAVALLVFGPKKLPELGAGLGKSLRAFREATTEAKDAFTVEVQPKKSPDDSSDRE